MSEASPRNHSDAAASLAKSIAIALAFPPAVMRAIETSCREEFQRGLTRALVREDLLEAWERWLKIRRHYPSIGDAQFFREEWRDISVLERSAELKSKPPEPSPERTPLEPGRDTQPHITERSQRWPRRRFYQPPSRPDMSVGVHDPNVGPVVYTADQLAFMELGKEEKH